MSLDVLAKREYTVNRTFGSAAAERIILTDEIHRLRNENYFMDGLRILVQAHVTHLFNQLFKSESLKFIIHINTDGARAYAIGGCQSKSTLNRTNPSQTVVICCIFNE